MILSRCSFRLQTKHVVFGVIVVLVLDYFGLFSHIFELDFNEKFQYPYVGDVSDSVQRLRQKLKPDIEPINIYNHTFLNKCEEKCRDQTTVRVLYLVKSSADNFQRREAIRQTWGYEHRFSDVTIRTVFFLGLRPDVEDLQGRIDKERKKFKDIVQVSFIDSYLNNTIKTMSAFRWAVEYCPQAQFYFFSDDDMYVSTKNVLRFIRNPTNYPKYLEDSVKDKVELKNKRKRISQVFDFELPGDALLYAGFVFVSSPHRHKTSKWYVSLGEYPYKLWPPYVTAGAYVLSKEALTQLYYTSFYTKHFRFDDVFLGLVAMKARIEPFHSDAFHFYKLKNEGDNYKYVLASHGYSDPGELKTVWNVQRSSGNA